MRGLRHFVHENRREPGRGNCSSSDFACVYGVVKTKKQNRRGFLSRKPLRTDGGHWSAGEPINFKKIGSRPLRGQFRTAAIRLSAVRPAVVLPVQQQIRQDSSDLGQRGKGNKIARTLKIQRGHGRGRDVYKAIFVYLRSIPAVSKKLSSPVYK